MKRIRDKIFFSNFNNTSPSIKVKVFSSFTLFSIIIIMFLWMLQTVFITVFYESMKQTSVMRGASEAKLAYETLSGDDLEQQILDISSDFDIYLNITTFDGSNFYTADPPGRDYSQELENFAKTSGENFVNPLYVVQIAAEIVNEPSHQISLYFEGSDNKRMLLNGQLLTSDYNEPAVMIVTSTLQPMNDTVLILSQQLIYITIIIFATGIILSIFISNSVAKPIVSITKQAQQLSGGDFDIEFEYGKFDEVNKLAYTLNYATKELKQVEGLRMELIANVSHDLRTPLTMIKAYAEMVRDLSGDNPEKRNAHLQIIVDESDRLTGLVQNLLDLSKLQAGVENLNPTAFDINAKLKSVCARFDELRENSGYKIEYLYDSALPLYVYADEQKIEQVIYNLVSNAINYTGNDKLIFIRTEHFEQHVRIFVKDTGDGISPENASHIWERYYRSKEHKRSVAGSGIGLSIVKSVLELHGMDYGVNGNPGDGAEFWFDLKKHL